MAGNLLLPAYCHICGRVEKNMKEHQEKKLICHEIMIYDHILARPKEDKGHLLVLTF